MDDTGEPGREAGGTGRYTLALAFARVAGWLIVPLYVAGICTNYVLERGAGLLDGTDPIANVEGMLFNAGFGAFAVVGALLLVKRPANPIGWIMAAIAFMLSVAPTGGAYATYVMVTRGQPDALAVFGAWVVNWFWFLFLALALVYLPMLFPDGRLLSRRWLPVAIFAGIAPMTVVVLGALRETLPVNAGYRIDNPIGIEGLGSVEKLPVFGVLTGLFFVGFAGVVASVVVRFRRSSERSGHTEGVGYLGQQNGVANGHPASCAGLRPQNHGSMNSAAFDLFLGKSQLTHDRHPLYDSVRHNSLRPGEPMDSAASSSESNKGGCASGRVARGFGCVA